EKLSKEAIAIARDAEKARKKAIRDAEAETATLTAERNAVDAALFDPKQASPALARLTMTELMKRRADLQARIEAAELRW
ncbi:hypothetical protein LXJ58_31775, partial [Escherichia coli]|nr:hypothetical protein [Escherichia coli]